MTQPPRFSVIIPVCHGGRFLQRAMETVTAQDFPAQEYEVIVAAEARDNEAASICARAAERSAVFVQLLSEGARNRAALLNAACAKARGRWVVFSDDDCVFPADWLRRWSEEVEKSPRAGLIGGVDELQPGGSGFDEGLDWLLNSRIGTGGYRTPSGADAGPYYPKLWNMATPREALEEAALAVIDNRRRIFDETLDVHEDVELGARMRRAGKEVVFAPEVRVRHYRDTTFRSFVKRNFNMARACRRTGVQFAPHLFLAAGLAGSLGLTVLAAAYAPWRPALAAAAGLYLLVLGAGGVMAALTRKRVSLLLIAPALLAGVHVARGAGFMWPSSGGRRG